MLVYENVVEKVDKRDKDGGRETYWMKVPPQENIDWFTTTPCGICPVYTYNYDYLYNVLISALY